MDKAPHFLGKVATKAIVAKDGKVLMTRDHSDTDIWDLPGGKIDAGESIEQGIKREVMEELGVDIHFKALVFSEQVIHKRDGTVYLFITCEVTMDDPSQPFKVPSEELAEVQWMSKEMLGDLKMHSNCLSALKAYWKVR